MEVPKLRFKEFDSPWEQVEVGKIGEFFGGGTPDTNVEEFWSGDIPWISSSDIIDNDINRVNITRFISQDAIKKSATKLIPKDSVLIVSRVGVGKFAVAPTDVTTSQDFTNLVLNKNLFNNSFFAYNLYQNRNLLHQIAQGTSIKGFTTVDLKKVKLRKTSLSEQQKIADFLQTADERIALLKEKKELLERYKKGVMQKIFSQQLRFKDDNGNDFPRWEERKIKDTLSIGSGRDYKHLAHGKVPVYGSGGLMTYVSDFIYDGESVGIGRKGTINKPVYLSGKFWTVDTLFYTHSFKKVLPKYIYYCFLTINWLQHNEAGGVPSLTKSTIESIILLVPSLPEQQKISHFLTSIDEKISTTKNQLESTELWKKGLLQQMLV